MKKLLNEWKRFVNEAMSVDDMFGQASQSVEKDQIQFGKHKYLPDDFVKIMLKMADYGNLKKEQKRLVATLVKAVMKEIAENNKDEWERVAPAHFLETAEWPDILGDKYGFEVPEGWEPWFETWLGKVDTWSFSGHREDIPYQDMQGIDMRDFGYKDPDGKH